MGCLRKNRQPLRADAGGVYFWANPKKNNVSHAACVTGCRTRNNNQPAGKMQVGLVCALASGMLNKGCFGVLISPASGVAGR